jgi:hypothetical protein
VDRDGFLRIMTNLLDVPAEILALIYQYRWQIEVKTNRPWRLPHVQAPAGLPASAEPSSRRDQDSNVLRDHHLPADQSLDRPPTDQTHARDVVLLPDGLGDWCLRSCAFFGNLG